jgi:choice-of-anchor B domain-containing protein
MAHPYPTILSRLLRSSLWSLLLAFSLVFGVTLTVQGHSGGAPLRYVADDGLDRGDCHQAHAPCRTIGYALSQAIPGDEVRVAAGTYYVPNSDLALILSELIRVRGGYSRTDVFTRPDPSRNKSYLIGLGRSSESLLARRGFSLVRDAKSIDLGQAAGSDKVALSATAPTSFTPCRHGFAGSFPCRGIDLLARLPLAQFSSNPTAANDVWGYVDLDDNREYALIGLRNGTAVVEVTNPLAPVEVGLIPGPSTIWRDIKVFQFYNLAQNRWDAYAYSVADQVNQGLQIIDLSDLPNAISLTRTYTGFKQAHNIYLSDIDYTTGLTQSGSTAYAYILGSERHDGGFRILDLSDPVAPLEIAAPLSADYVHDATSFVITDSRTADCQFDHNPCEIYVDFNESTVDLWDVTDKQQPFQISSTPYAGSGYTHSGWWSADKRFIFIQDELDERFFGQPTTLRTLDISDLTSPFISRVWEGPSPAIDHNGFSQASHYYMSNYRRGLTVLNVANPNEPHDIAFFDTFPNDDSANFNGAWGTYPYLPSGTILVSDIEGGLFLLREQGLAIRLTGPAQSPLGLPLTYTLTVTNHGILPATDLVLTDKLPSGVVHLSGGSLNGDVVSWGLPTLPPGAVSHISFVVTPQSSGILVNSEYGGQAKGSIAGAGVVNVNGEPAVITLVTATTIYLPLIIKN